MVDSKSAFDFITDEQFRTVLSSDKEEMYQCLNSDAWKAVHVLAGSIIECVILDYLIAEGHMNRDKALTVDLGSAIKMAAREGIISGRVSDLSRVVKDYRNLVHPGRAIRTGETPDSNSATIVARLLEMILAEIGDRKRKNYGYTADQIVTKLSRDSSSMAILQNLLKDVNEAELERLILDVIPDRYSSTYTLIEIDDIPSYLIPMLSKLLRTAVNIAPAHIQSKFARQFIRILKEESEWTVTTYCHEFFSMKMLRHLGDSEKQLVKEHYLEQLRSGRDEEKWVASLAGIGRYLNKNDLPGFFNALVSKAVRGCNGVRSALFGIFLDLDDDLAAYGREHLTSWISDFTISYRKLTESQVKTIRDLISDAEIPF
ncbi:MAG: hypothetical protein OXC12_04930 [Spirochaetaceae bacterium]|nr:hypothetical protein [Spirochaetaceae bacterium]